MAARLSIVLVEDNDDLRDLTADALRAEGHRVTALACAEELEDRARGVAADLFLIDLNLPGEDGFSLSRRIRKAQPLVGIVIVSARSDLQGKVDGYECGADWYLPKPVPIEELLAAISSFARRSHAQLVKQSVATGALRLERREVQGPGGVARLSGSEETVLTAFARAPSGILENWQLLELLDSDSSEARKASLEIRITRIRKKLRQAGAPDPCIESLRGIGYQLRVPIEVSA